VVGVNRYVESDVAAPSFRHDPKVERERARFLAKWRAGRNTRAVERALSRLDTEARGTGNLIPAILDALKSRATLGEVCDTMRAVFGTHKPSGER